MQDLAADYDGSGTETDPYQISTVEELQAIPDDATGYFEQVADIDASATRKWNDGAGFEPIGTHMTEFFNGHYDGNGYFIKNLHIDATKRNRADYTKKSVGLFKISAGKLKNTHLRDVNINNDAAKTGGLIGSSVPEREVDYTPTIQQCSVTGEIHGEGMLGGIVGSNAHVIDQCFFKGSLSGTGVGGIVGGDLFAKITNCYANANVSSDERGSLLADGCNYMRNCYAAGNVDYNPSALDAEGISGGLTYDHPNSDEEVENCYIIVEDTDDQSGGFFSSILSLFSNSDDNIVHGQAVSPPEAKGEVATEYLQEFDFENTWQTQPDEFPVLQWETDLNP